MPTLFTSLESPRVKLVLRDYQLSDHDECFRLWDSGVRGTLTRAATGLGKTPMSCMKALTWLARGDDYRFMVVSYEQQLVWQFAQEIEDFTGITPGIEMESNAIDPSAIPKGIVASRQSLLLAPPPTPEQLQEFRNFGLRGSLGAANKRHCERMLRKLRKGGEGVLDEVYELIDWINDQPEAHGDKWSRLHKFDWRLNWLIFFDEAHRHAYKLRSVGCLVDWFEQNERSRRNGTTATPKRGDGVSIGDKMFPGISCDFPLFHATKPCAVKEGWAVPYLQKYIAVEGVDFRQIFKIKDEFEQAAELERQLMEEERLAKLVEPLLDMVGDRRTIIFNPGVDMAKAVALYINARVQARCPECGVTKWYPSKLMGDGAQCPCGRFMVSADITKSGEQAMSINGNTPVEDRKAVYQAHQAGRFQFLSVCGLCREGYNDPDISCVAIFRPVSREASSLAEQMKGRGCRPCREIIALLCILKTAAERIEAICNSSKPNCLIVDLAGVTGLADCASTLQIYADGLPDEVVEEAEQILEACAETEDEAVDIQDVIEQAQQAVEEKKRRAKEEAERVKREREEAERRARELYERRAKADAQVTYTVHEMGVGANVQADANLASEGQMKFMAILGMVFTERPTKKQARRIINQLRLRHAPGYVAYLNGFSSADWEPRDPSEKQLDLLQRRGVDTTEVKTPYDASQLISAMKEPDEFRARKLEEILKAKSAEELTAIGMDMRLVQPVCDQAVWEEIVEAGKAKRSFFRESAA